MHHRLPLSVLVALAVLAPFAASTQPLDLPPRKPGQWEMRMVTEKPAGGPAITSQMCLDAVTDRELMEFGLKMSKGTCQRFDMKKAGAGWVINAECALRPSEERDQDHDQRRLSVEHDGTNRGDHRRHAWRWRRSAGDVDDADGNLEGRNLR